LCHDYQAFCRRDLGEYAIVYLFVGSIAERIRPGQKREPVLAAPSRPPGARVGSAIRYLSSVMVRPTSSRRPVGRGIPTAPLGETGLPRSARQRCLAHRLRNLAAPPRSADLVRFAAGAARLLARLVPEDQWPGFKALVQAAYQAPSRAIVRDLAAGVVDDHEGDLPNAVACFRNDREACIAHLRLPIGHRRAIRTTNPLERLFVEERRRLKIIPNAFGEKPVLKLIFGVINRGAERCRSSKITTFGRRQPDALRKQPDHDYKAENGLKEARSVVTLKPESPAVPGLDLRNWRIEAAIGRLEEFRHAAIRCDNSHDPFAAAKIYIFLL
jgi:hypothetical protein